MITFSQYREFSIVTNETTDYLTIDQSQLSKLNQIEGNHALLAAGLKVKKKVKELPDYVPVNDFIAE